MVWDAGFASLLYLGVVHDDRLSKRDRRVKGPSWIAIGLVRAILAEETRSRKRMVDFMGRDWRCMRIAGLEETRRCR
jgi:hypothetical protein